MPLDPRDEARLTDMVAYGRDAIQLLGARSVEEMVADLAVRLALVRCIEVIGEAGHQVSASVQAALPTVPWHAMWGMRNRLIHDYGNTNFKVVHDVARHDLPELVRAIDGYLARPENR